jgi:AICAR transformylase/IMP cyclohydrolase PurH
MQNLLEDLWIAKSLFKSIITKKWCPTEWNQLQTNMCWSAHSQAIAKCCCYAKMKSTLGVGPKVKDSIEDPFK